MDYLLFLLLSIPVIGGALASLAGVSKRPRNTFLRLSGLLAGIACTGIMGLIVYRRFYMPLGAQQLAISWGDWFSAPPLVVPFSLRMDTLAGILCGLVILFGTVAQAMAIKKKQGPALRGTYSLVMAACLLFILADNLVPVFAALVMTGPFMAIAAFRRGLPSERLDKAARVFVFHGIGDALALLGLFFLYASLGTLSYKPLAALVAGMPSLNPGASVGVLLLLAGITLHGGPGWVEALLSLAGAVYVGYRIDGAVRLIPGGFLFISLVLVGFWTLAVLGPAAGVLPRLSTLSERLPKRINAFLTGFGEDFLFGGLARKGSRGVVRVSRFLANFAASPKGFALTICAALFAAGLIFVRVR